LKNPSVQPKNSMKKILHISLLLTLAGPSFALQALDATNGATLFANISKKEPTRIALDQGRIAALRTREGVINVAADELTGQLFVSVPPDSIAPVNAFLTTESGSTYTLIMTIADIPSDSIIIKQPRPPSKTQVLSGPNAGLFTNDIKKLLLSIATETPQDGVRVNSERQEISLWAEAKFTQELQFVANDAVAESFVLKNVSASPMVLSEREFYKRGVHAVAIEQHTLAAGESTKIFIAREKALND
jgi:conjugal transfer pilus assembly protein TraK